MISLKLLSRRLQHFTADSIIGLVGGIMTGSMLVEMNFFDHPPGLFLRAVAGWSIVMFVRFVIVPALKRGEKMSNNVLAMATNTRLIPVGGGILQSATRFFTGGGMGEVETSAETRARGSLVWVTEWTFKVIYEGVLFEFSQDEVATFVGKGLALQKRGKNPFARDSFWIGQEGWKRQRYEAMMFMLEDGGCTLNRFDHRTGNYRYTRTPQVVSVLIANYGVKKEVAFYIGATGATA